MADPSQRQLAVFGSVNVDFSGLASHLAKAGETLRGMRYRIGCRDQVTERAGAAARVQVFAHWLDRAGMAAVAPMLRTGLSAPGVWQDHLVRILTRAAPTRIAAFAVAAMLLAAPAVAQQASSPGVTPSLEASTPKVAPPDPTADNHLFGDWGGMRSYLNNLGIDFNLDYVTETAGNVTGGLRKGVDYADQFGFQLDIDWEKLAGITGFSTHLNIVHRDGRNLSSDYIGDNVIQAQEIYGAGFGTALRDVWLYGEEKAFNDRLDFVFGRVFPGMDFAASPLYCHFMTLTICGHPRALTQEQGFIDWPLSTWGGRLKARPTTDTYVMFGVYASEPFPAGGPTGWNWSTNVVTGAYYAMELGWEPVFGPSQLSGHYKIGFAYDTSAFPDNLADTNGQPFVLTGLPPRMQHGRGQFWVTFDQMLLRTGPGPNEGLTVLAAYAHDDGDNSLYQHFVWAGLLYSGFWRDRPHDQIGLGITYYKIAPSLTQTETLEQEFDLAPTYAYGVQTHATVFELNYQLPVYRGVTLQPEMEYFLRPGGVSRVPSAFVLGLKTHVVF
ncbi:MAG TPA: carbohydrate porin [Acetobacteraceae bacterium]|nr:carbohydrate porin [Acetobacteraceae bacterium]